MWCHCNRRTQYNKFVSFHEQNMEQCIRQNNAIEIYEGYFETTDDATRWKADIISYPNM